VKKLFLIFFPTYVICLYSCKNTDITNPISPAIAVHTPPVNLDAPPPGTPVLETPEAYNTFITDRQLRVYEYIAQMSDAAKVSSENAIDVISKAGVQIEQLTNEIKAMPPYKGNDAMRDAAIALFEYYEDVFNHKYQQLIGYTSRRNLLTEDEVIQMQELSAEIISEEKRLHEKFKIKQQLFAEANKMEHQSYSSL
jgi:hypothetical protein